MRYKKIAVFLLILSVILTVSCVSAVEENITSSDSFEVYISPDGDDNLGDGSPQNPYASIGYAINSTSMDSTIYLNEGKYSGENNRNITLDKSVTLIGKSKESTIVDCESISRLFTMNSNAKLTLINLTLTNGFADFGGLIYNDGGEITIKNSILSNSKAQRNAGAIISSGTLLIIEDSCIMNNTATKYGGAVFTSGNTDVKNSIFTKNVLTAGDSVGACMVADGILNLDGCTFSDSYSVYSAGALLNLGNATINNCRFVNLSTNYTGGAISNHKYALINNSYFGYNDVQYYAAALLAPPSGHHVLTEVYNSIFEKNHAGYLAAVSNNYEDTDLFMKNCVIVGNYLIENEKFGDFGLDETATIQYCWWGQNTISSYYYCPHNSNYTPQKINASRWLVMTFSANNGVVYKNKDNLVTVDLNYYYDNETKQIYKLNETINLPLEVTVHTFSQSITKKLVNGVATFNIKPNSYEDVVYATINNQTLYIKVDSKYTTLVVNDFVKYYQSSKKLSVKLVNCNNAGIKGEKVSIQVDGKTYTAYTNSYGIANFYVKNTPNKFNIKVIYNGNKYYTGTSKTIKVKILKPIIKVSKTTVRKNKQLVVTFKTADNKVIKNTKVKSKINGKTYYKTTNSKGQAKLTIKLKANKKYTVKVGFKSTSTYGTTCLTTKIKVIR